jgi:hypothetical protein
MRVDGVGRGERGGELHPLAAKIAKQPSAHATARPFTELFNVIGTHRERSSP